MVSNRPTGNSIFAMYHSVQAFLARDARRGFSSHPIHRRSGKSGRFSRVHEPSSGSDLDWRREKRARAYQQRCPVGSAIATCRVRRVARRNDERRGSPGGGVRRGSLGQGGGLVGERFAPGSSPPAKKFGLPEASVRYPFYPALFPRVARGSDPAPDPDPVSLPIISHRRGRERGGCHIRHAVDSRRARRPRRRGRGAPALRDGRRRSTVSARYTAHRGGERGPPHEREVARGVRAMRSRPTAAELELSVRAPPAERRRADAGGEARGRRARGSPSFARRQPERSAPGTCDTPLTAAATCGHADVLERLLKAGADVDGVAQWAGRTALVAAAESDSAEARRCCEILKPAPTPTLSPRGWLGDAWATAPSTPPPRAWTATWSVSSSPPAQIRTGARETRTPRMSSRDEPPPRAPSGAPTSPSEDSTTRHSTSPSPPTSTRRRNDASRRTPRARARPREAEGSPAASRARAQRRAIEVVKTLLESGADHGAFVVDSTPLHMAALGGAVDVVDLLMKNGADVNARAPNGYTTPLEAAARYAADIILDFHSGDDDAEEPAERSDPNRGGRRAARVMARAATRSKTDPPPRTRLGLGRRLIRTRTIPKPPTTISRQWRRFATPRVPFAR